jgi:hypothetical protein
VCDKSLGDKSIPQSQVTSWPWLIPLLQKLIVYRLHILAHKQVVENLNSKMGGE